MQQLLIEAHAKLCAMFPGHIVSIQVTCANYCVLTKVYLAAMIAVGDDFKMVASEAKSIAELLIKAQGYARTQHRASQPVNDSAISAGA